MIHLIFTIHDSKAEAFLPPFILPRAEMAKRTFADCVNSADHQFGVHPADYTLFRLGTFDDERAKYTIELTPVSEGNGLEFVRPPTPDRQNAISEISEPQVGNGSPILPGSSGNNTPE